MTPPCRKPRELQWASAPTGHFHLPPRRENSGSQGAVTGLALKLRHGAGAGVLRQCLLAHNSAYERRRSEAQCIHERKMKSERQTPEPKHCAKIAEQARNSEGIGTKRSA